MIVLSRSTDQSILIGDLITVTVINIDAPRVEILIGIEQSETYAETTINLEQGQQINFQNDFGIAILNITGLNVQIGIIAPEGTKVTRKEQFNPKPAIKPLFVAVAENQKIRIGEHLLIDITDIDQSGMRVLIKGEIMGGPEDGKTINEPREVGTGGHLQIGPLVTISLMRIAGTLAHLSVVRPNHMKIEVG